MEESKETHHCCIDRLGVCYVSPGKGGIGRRGKCVFGDGRVKQLFVDARRLCKGKGSRMEVFLYCWPLRVQFTPLRLRCRFDAPQRAAVSVCVIGDVCVLGAYFSL